MKVLVAFLSETGNTAKLANGIFEAVTEAEKDLLPIPEVQNAADYDLIFCGFPVHAHSVPGKVEAFVKSIPEGKKIAFFATHGSLRGGELAITAFYHALTIGSKLKILGTFGSRGQVKPALIDALMQKLENKAWAEEAQSAAGHPDKADIDDVKAFAQTMVMRARAR